MSTSSPAGTGGFLADADLSVNRIEHVRQRMAAGPGYIDLTGSNPTTQGLLFPPDILRAAAEPYWGSRRYAPDAHGHPPALEAIRGYYAGRAPALALRPDQIFITASTSEAYSLLFALLTEPGDNVLGPDVGYPLFDYLASVHHIAIKPYRLDPDNGWAIDPESLAGAADERTRAVLLISPHNPTGMIVRQPIPALSRLGLPVISDEVFAEFTYAAASAPPLGGLHPDLPVFHLNGISKLFALPDLKLGWIAATGGAEAYRERLEMLVDTFLGANSLTQSMLPAMFARGWPFVRAMSARVRTNFDLALAALAGHTGVRALAPDGGYNLFCAVPGWTQAHGPDEEGLVVHLLERGVLVHPGYFFNYESGVAHIMVSCLTETEVLRAGLAHLCDALPRT